MPPPAPKDDRAAQAIAAAPLPQPQVLRSMPGITRDGTQFDHQTYIDGVWCRFWQDLPRKILGYREQVRDVSGVARCLNVFSSDGFTYVHMGTTSAFQRYAINLVDGTNTGTISRTPAGFSASADVLWQSDTIFQQSGGTTSIFAAPLLTLNDITASDDVQVYYGDVLGTAILVPATEVVAAQSAGVAQPQTLVGPGNLVLNINAPIPVGAGHTTITTDGNLTAVNYTITGFDMAGAPLTVGPTSLPNNVTADTGVTFGSVSQVTLTAGTGAFHVSVGWLVGSNNLTTSGGLCCVGPYLFLYGHDGVIQWSVPGIPLNFNGVGSGDSRPVPDKIVRGMPLRGQAAPAAIFWSLSSVIIGNFVGGTTFWNFTTVTTSSSILSANSVVEHKGIYYWATTSGFAMFGGVAQDIPNEYNQQYFLDNLNYAARQKVFAYKVPRFGEIWWCFPFGNSTECNHAIVYNYLKNYWFDTPLPNAGRGAGYYDVTYNFPIMSGVVVNSDTGGTSMWQHEIGLDEVSGGVAQSKAILSSFRTHELNMIKSASPGGLGLDKQMSFSTLEPDYNQSKDLTFEVFSRANARATVRQTDALTILAVPTKQSEQLVEFKWEGRLNSFQITSNDVGGNYTAGSPLIHLHPSNGRRTG